MEDMKAKTGKKWFYFTALLLLSICGTLWFFLKKPIQYKTQENRLLVNKEAYFFPLKIKGFSSANIPYFDVDIENRTVAVKIDLGYEGDISLPSDFLQELSTKKFVKRESSYGLRGKTYINDIYEVEKIHIENITFFPVKAKELNPEFEQDVKLGKKREILENELGSVGWCLFYNFNLLIDCAQSTLALCDGLDSLKKQGYPVDSFTETPLILDRGFIEFEARTDDGMVRCILDSGSTWNMLNKDLENSYNEHMIFNSKNVDEYSSLNPENKSLLTFDYTDVLDVSVFKIGGKDFGPMTFNRIKSPLEIDAIIGMEFFEETLVFIDFSNRKLYFFEHPLEEAK